MRKIHLTLLILLIGNIATAQNNPLGLSLIRTEELKKDLYEFASAHFKGRSAGTLDELNAAMWLGDKV